MQEKVKRKTDLLLEDRDVKGKVLPVCYLCNLVPSEGIRSGFFLKGVFICSKCEQDLIKYKADDTERYKFVIDRLRDILFKKGSGKSLPEFK